MQNLNVDIKVFSIVSDKPIQGNPTPNNFLNIFLLKSFFPDI